MMVVPSASYFFDDFVGFSFVSSEKMQYINTQHAYNHLSCKEILLDDYVYFLGVLLLFFSRGIAKRSVKVCPYHQLDDIFCLEKAHPTWTCAGNVINDFMFFHPVF